MDHAQFENEPPRIRLHLVGGPNEPLHRVLYANCIAFALHVDPGDALSAASEGDAVLVLARGYPESPTPLPDELIEEAARRGLRLYVEFPEQFPGVTLDTPRQARWERAVVTGGMFEGSPGQGRILDLHGCHFMPSNAPAPDMVLARVAGFDHAVHGLDDTEAFPLLARLHGDTVLLATSKLSSFGPGRYAPSDAWPGVWRGILNMLVPGIAPEPLVQDRPVRPAMGPGDAVTRPVERETALRGAKWFDKAGMLIHPSWSHKIEEAHSWDDRVAPGPEPGWTRGDGSLGVLEGFNSRIQPDGGQYVRWYLRADCACETAMALALASRLGETPAGPTEAANLLQYVYETSPIATGSRADPESSSYGLLGWTAAADACTIYYGDDNARALLSSLAASSAMGDPRWDRVIIRGILANFRTTGVRGFRGSRIEEAELQAHGWRHYHNAETVHCSPHFESWLWTLYFWLYHKTGHRPLLDRPLAGVRAVMEAYPADWRWTNGIQQERARMLLPLAFLVRADDRPEHREWLRKMAGELLAAMDPCGAIREEIGGSGMGMFGPPASNNAYGTNEASLVQANGDPVCDLLYTTNFAFVGLHEAAAATGESLFKDAADRLAGFLCRIQARSGEHPEFDGAWYRAFDYGRWDYWASNADHGWGVWSVETGWTQGWITAVLAMRASGTSLWDLACGTGAAASFDDLQGQMLPNP